MERFTKEIAVGTKPTLFAFTRMQNVNGTKFFVTLKDENNKNISFSLVQAKEQRWKLMPGSLRWLYDIEPQLEAAIFDTRLK